MRVTAPDRIRPDCAGDFAFRHAGDRCADCWAGEERDASGKPKVTLADALERGWLELWYQPKINLQTSSWSAPKA